MLLPKRNENTCPQKDLYMMFVAAVFIIAPKWKQNPRPINKGRDKQL